MDKLLTVSDVAEVLVITEEKVRILIRQKKLRALQLTDGPRAPYRIRGKDLANYIETRLAAA